MPWQADLLCQIEPYILEGLVAKYVQCQGHLDKDNPHVSYRHHAPVYFKEEKEYTLVSDDWGFIIPSVVDDPKDFEAGKLVCSSCGCYVHRDKRESHREKCNFV